MGIPQIDPRSVTDAENVLLEYVRAHIRFADDHYRVPDGWRYKTSSHLLLAQGRLFTPGPLPAQIGKLADRFCFRNASVTARAHAPLLYAEGIAAFTVAGTTGCLPHAWCVTSDGTAIDPTWDPGTGVAYLGVAIADVALWPTDTVGLLDDYQRSTPLLRDGLPPGSIADLGRSPTPAP